MAETTTKKSTSRAKKTTEEVVATETDTNDIIAKLMAQIEEQNKQMAELKEQINAKQTVVVQSATDDKFSTQKIKCINLMHNPINVSTETNGNGRVFTFEKYGDSRLIRFDELSDIVSAYPNTMEQGLIYITNKDAVEMLGLTEDYENVYDKATMDKLIMLREEVDLELFLGLNDNLMESTAIEIAKRINANEQVDYNYLARIKAETKYDILAMADDLKKSTTKKK